MRGPVGGRYLARFIHERHPALNQRRAGSPHVLHLKDHLSRSVHLRGRGKAEVPRTEAQRNRTRFLQCELWFLHLDLQPELFVIKGDGRCQIANAQHHAGNPGKLQLLHNALQLFSRIIEFLRLRKRTDDSAFEPAWPSSDRSVR